MRSSSSVARTSSVTAELLTADHDARAIAQTEFVRPLVLEAGAGTGKTAALVARVITIARRELPHQRLASAGHENRRADSVA